MIKSNKFLGICILIAAVIISASLVYINKESRYKVAGARVFDTREGKFITEVKESPLSIPSNASNVINNEKATPTKSELPITLGDVSKVKIVGDTFDNSYLYKIDCTVKNEDILDNNIYIQATLFDKNKSPINIIKSSTGLISPNETEVFRLETTDYNMTSKYKSYKLEIIQDKNISWTDKRRKELGIK